MTVAFLVLRRGFIKVIGSVIQAALDRGHRALLLWDPEEPKSGEAVTETDLAAWPGAVRVRYRRGAPLVPVLAGHGARALVAPALYQLLRDNGLEAELDALRAAGVRTYSLDYVFETVTSAPEAFRGVDVTFYTSAHQRELHRRLLADRFAALGPGVDLDARHAVVGSTMTDQLAVVDRAAVRRRWGLGPSRPVVVLMSLKMAVPDPWRRLVWGSAPRAVRAARALATGHRAWVGEILRSHGYRDFARALRGFCDRAGAALVVKSRAKNADPRFLRRLADVFVYDESVYPYTSIELMAVASLCVHFQSGAVLEAAFAGVPSVSVAVSQAHLKGFVSFDEAFGGRPGSLQNFPGIVWPVTGEEAAGRLAAATLGDFGVDADARRRYVEKFLGYDDTRASGRVLEAIERLSGR